MRKHGLANLYAFLMRARDDRKVTPGITELSRLRVHKNSVVRFVTLVIHLYSWISYQLIIDPQFLNRSTARFATSMSALPILVVQKYNQFVWFYCWLPRVGVFTHQKGSWAGFRTLWDSLFDIYWKCWESERKEAIVREELAFRGLWSTGYLIRYAGQLRLKR